MALGVLPEYRRLGLDAVFGLELAEVGRHLGFRRAELGWTLEDNPALRRLFERGSKQLGLRRTKTYRLYERALT